VCVCGIVNECRSVQYSQQSEVRSSKSHSYLREAVVAIPLDQPFDVAAIRRDFPILEQRLAGDLPLIYLDTAATSQKPSSVISKVIECYEQYNSNVHRGIHQLGDRMTTELELTREKIRHFLGAREADEIVFTSGTTMSINLVAHGWARKFLTVGDEILVNPMEHHANLVPWQLAASASGAVLRHIPLTAEGCLDLNQGYNWTDHLGGQYASSAQSHDSSTSRISL